MSSQLELELLASIDEFYRLILADRDRAEAEYDGEHDEWYYLRAHGWRPVLTVRTELL